MNEIKTHNYWLLLVAIAYPIANVLFAPFVGQFFSDSIEATKCLALVPPTFAFAVIAVLMLKGANLRPAAIFFFGLWMSFVGFANLWIFGQMMTNA